MKRFNIILILFILLIPSCEKDEDGCDGDYYQTVVIGNQTWMAENLNCYVMSESKAFQDIQSNAEIYGRLYKWETACTVCPDGWHLPSEAEWTELIEYLGGDSIAGGKMKQTGTNHWKSPNTGATNSSGFNALGAGSYPYFRLGAEPDNEGWNAHFWTSSMGTLNNFSRAIGLSYSGSGTSFGQYRQGCYLSVRCVKDE